MTCLFRKMEKKANCFWSTINPRESFMFSLFLLSSSAFCVSVADKVQKSRTDERTDPLNVWLTALLMENGRTDGLTDLAGWLNDCLTDGRTYWLTYQLVDWLKDARTDGRPHWLAVSQSDRRGRRQTYGLTDWLTDGQIDWLAGWLTDVRDRPHDGVNLILAHCSRLAL